MKAVRIPGPRKVDIIELPSPEIKAGEVLLKIDYVGFCGSDLNTWRGANAMAKPEVIPGHEVSATVAGVGEGVPASFAEGLRVTVNPYTACGCCPSCRAGRPNACEHNETLGVQRDGAMREYLSLPWQKVIPAPGLKPEEVALVEPMSVGFHAVSRAQVTDTDTVMVIGCGMVGLGAVVRSSLRGARVIAADIDPEKLEVANSLGAAWAFDTTAPDFHEKLMEVTGGEGPDVIIEAVGSQYTYHMAVEEVAFAGRLVCIGYAKGEVTLPTSLFVKKELDVRGSRNALPMDFEAVISYLRGASGSVDRLISAVVDPSDAQKALETWDAAPGKVFRILVRI